MSVRKLTVITGGSKGIGYACGLKFAKQGNSVLLISRSDDIQNIALSLPKINTDQAHFGLTCDISEEEQIKNLYKEIKALGEIECLINNAGINRDGLLATVSTKNILEMININLLGTLFMCKNATRVFMRQHYGNIINISSVLGLTGNAGQTVYSASKSGVIGLTKSLAKELAPLNIRVNAIAPGYIETNMTKEFSLELKKKLTQSIPLKRFGRVEEIGEAAWFINQSQYITGTVLAIDGGLST